MTLLLVLQAFGIATLISFAGSVQLGPVNFGTIQTALNKNFKSALLFGFGGSLPELLYSGLAIGGSSLLDQYEGLEDYLKYFTAAILLAFGVYLLFQKASSGMSEQEHKPGKSIWLGVTFGLLNPQLLPFWLVVITTLKSNNIMVDNSLPVQVAFVLGTAAGAFLLQYVVAVVTTRKRAFLYTKLTKNYNKVLGSVIIAVALILLIINL